MLRLWLLMWYFTRTNRVQSPQFPSWRDDISWGDFAGYLNYEKNFLEDWRETLRRWYYLGLKRGWPSGTTESGRKRAQQQIQLINDTISFALEKKYLEFGQTSTFHPTQSEQVLTTNARGRRLVRNPLVFLEAVAKEYSSVEGRLITILVSIGGTLLVTFWIPFTTWLAGIIS